MLLKEILLSLISVLVAWLLSFSTVVSVHAQSVAPETCSETGPAIFEAVSPAVVLIDGTSINPYRTTDRVQHSLGTGFIIDAKGLVLTNSHVALGRQSLMVRLQDGTSLPARLLGTDPLLDLAVLQIPIPTHGALPIVRLGDSSRVRVGEDVLALGNPLGLEQSLTRGIVSATNRLLPPTFLALQQPLIQVDTPINHGNSGGPLLNRCGEVVGITTAVIQDAQNIGLVIPINLAKSILPSLLTNGRLIRPWLGFHGQFVDARLQQLLRLPLTTGFLIEAIDPGSPAEQVDLRGGELELTVAGNNFLLGGDIVTEINGVPIDSPSKLNAMLQDLQVGSRVKLAVFRQGAELEFNYILPERPFLQGDGDGTQAAFIKTSAHSNLRF